MIWSFSCLNCLQRVLNDGVFLCLRRKVFVPRYKEMEVSVYPDRQSRTSQQRDCYLIIALCVLRDRTTLRKRRKSMVEMLLVGGIVGILLVILIVLLLVLLQRRGLAKLQAQQRAWERAQEARQQRWIEQQEKYTTDTAKKLMLQVEQLRAKWQEWEAHDAERVTKLTRQNEAAIARLRIESEVARLPRVEDMPLPTNEKKRTIKRQEHRQPPCLQGEDLSGRDLSYRYLAQADLRNAQLANANLFMADLSGARLAGANLTGADLSAANLTRADLRGANLTETNVLVSDLKQAILTGTDLRKAGNL